MFDDFDQDEELDLELNDDFLDQEFDEFQLPGSQSINSKSLKVSKRTQKGSLEFEALPEFDLKLELKKDSVLEGGKNMISKEKSLEKFEGGE